MLESVSPAFGIFLLEVEDKAVPVPVPVPLIVLLFVFILTFLASGVSLLICLFELHCVRIVEDFVDAVKAVDLKKLLLGQGFAAFKKRVTLVVIGATIVEVPFPEEMLLFTMAF